MWREICGISTFSSAKDAMIQFCNLQRKVEGSNAPPYNMKRGLKLDPNIANLYAFSAVVGYKSNLYHEKVISKPKYGPDFAEFIRKNKLGRLIETWDGLWNKNHPNHKVKIWLWSPSFKNLSAWWEKNRPSSVVETPYTYTYEKARIPSCTLKEIKLIEKGKGSQVVNEDDEDIKLDSIDLVETAKKIKRARSKIRKKKP